MSKAITQLTIRLTAKANLPKNRLLPKHSNLHRFGDLKFTTKHTPRQFPVFSSFLSMQLELLPHFKETVHVPPEALVGVVQCQS